MFKKSLFILLLAAVSIGSARERKTVLITGGAGFIGSNFVSYLYEKYPEYDLIVLDALTYAGSLENIDPAILGSERFRFIHGSVADCSLVEKVMGECQLVVHFAAETHVTRSIADDLVFFVTDVLGTRALMSALVKHAKTVERFIHVSTSEVYGTAEEGRPMDEEHPLNPRSPYAAAKAGADRLVYAYGCTFDVPVVTVRPFNNYGPRQHPEKMIPRFIAAAIQKKPLQIHGTGDQCRDWVHTSDVAAALDAILHYPDFSKLQNQAINLGSGKATSVMEIAQAVLEAFDLPPTFLEFVDERPGQVACHLAEIGKAASLLDWKARTCLKEGLANTIEWYVNNPTYWRNRWEE